MTDAARHSGEWPRVLAHLRGERPGPLLVALGGIHGNEPAGLLAMAKVIERLQMGGFVTAGDFIGLSGNRNALARGVRYVERDLNRGWTDDALLEAATARGPEDREQTELRAAIEDALARARGRASFLDLHTTSADGIPFVVAGDGDEERAFAEVFGPPVFLGLIDRLSSALVPWLAARGVLAIAFEGGQNESAHSVAHHEAAIWVALATTGVVRARDLPEVSAAKALLEGTRRGLPRAIRIDHRHEIHPGDDFRMEPGFSNIQPVTAGTLLARDRSGEIRAREDCMVVMPLYQGQGDDGFFLGRAVGRP